MKTLINASLVTAIGIGSAMAAFAVPAQAGERAESGVANTRSLTVSYNDLDLSRQAGIDALYGRLKAAATKVCSPKVDQRNLAMHSDWEQCYGSAMDNAVAMVAHVGLSQVHLARTGHRNDAGREVAGSQ